MSSPSLSESSPRPRNRLINSSFLALNPHSRNAINRMLKHRTLKEEISAFYARQSEGLPFIPSYLSESVYAHLVREQFILFSKRNEYIDSENIEKTVTGPSNTVYRKIQQNLFQHPFDDLPFSVLDISSNGNKVPSAKEYTALSTLLNQSQYNFCLATLDLRLPTAWDVRSKNPYIEVGADNLQLTYTGDGKDDTDVASIRANHAIRKQCGIYYFEIKIISKGIDGHIGIGFCRKANSHNRYPGWGEHSYGYHGENGNICSGLGTEKSYGPKFGTGDVIGCGINFRNMTAFYTKNGLYLGTAFKNIKDTDVSPFVGFKTHKEKIEANFGSNPFKFDIQQYITNEKRDLLYNIINNSSEKSKPRSSVINNSISKNNADNVIMEYLRHSGYNNTAIALEKAMRSESEQVDSVSQLDQDTIHRQDLRKYIISGDIDNAIDLCNTYYPTVLQENIFIEFKLQCRKFIEMVRKVQLYANRTVTNEDEYEAQILKVSKNNKRTTSHVDLDSFNLKNKKQKLNNHNIFTLQDVMDFGNALKVKYASELEKNRSMNTELLTAFSTLAYTDLSDKAVAYLYQIPHIETVVSELNSAILVSLGKHPNSSIERIYRQTAVTIEELALGGNAKASLLHLERDCIKTTNV